MKKVIKTIIPSIIMFILIYLMRKDKDILTGLYIIFPLIYIAIGLISSNKQELIISLILISITFIMPINLWFHMDSCIGLLIIYNLLSIISYFIKIKLIKKISSPN